MAKLFRTKKVYLLALFIFASGALIMLMTEKTESAINCCYHECDIPSRTCFGNLAYECWSNCDDDHFQDWCSPEDHGPGGQDCGLTGQVCINGYCTGASLSCGDGTAYNTCVSGDAPNFCNGNGEIVDNCGECGCPGSELCGPNETFCCDNACNASCDPPGCTVAEDPDCGCLSGDSCCGLGCNYANDNECEEDCLSDGCNGICPACGPSDDPDCSGTPCCGNNVCDVDETPASCPLDCAATCAPDGCNNNCPNGCTPADSDPDCSNTACCGNTRCDGGETHQTCPGDCPDACLDHVCNGHCSYGCTALEDPDCGSGCCGDGYCNNGENNDSCPDDCPIICVPDGCNGLCPNLCTVFQDADCGCTDNNACCGFGCNTASDNDCPECFTSGECDQFCPLGCTHSEDPDCGCAADAASCCGRGCDMNSDPDCPEFLTVVITNPSDGSTSTVGTIINFRGIADGGALPYASYVWESSIDGYLGEGASLDFP